jgi:hypothetical protein
MSDIMSIEEIICKKYNIDDYKEVALYGNNLKEMIIHITKLHLENQLSSILKDIDSFQKLESFERDIIINSYKNPIQ